MSKLDQVRAGDRFGRWTVVGEITIRRFPSGGLQRRADAQCECGTVRNVPIDGLVSGKSKSCGCTKGESHKKWIAARQLNLEGETRGFWAYLKEAGVKNENRMILCRCACGTEKEITATSFINGLSVSCGCYTKQITSYRMKGKPKFNDLTGEQFGRYKVLGLSDEQLAGRRDKRWEIECTGCGSIKHIRSDTLKLMNLPKCSCVPPKPYNERKRNEHSK